MKTGIYWQDPKYAVGQCGNDPSCVLYLPLHRLDGVSFMSKDAYGHLCTVTGALWTSQGRKFDGLDDRIDIGTGSVPTLNPTNAMTLIVWANPSVLASSVYNNGDHYYQQGFRIYISLNKIKFYIKTVDGSATIESGVIAVNEKYCVIATYDKDGGANNVRMSVNNVEVTPATLTGTIVPFTAYDIGTRLGQSTWDYYTSLIGEALLHSRAFTLLEKQNYYLATKWRYQ